MLKLIDAGALYKRIVDLEQQAMSYVKASDGVAWKMWAAVLTERTAFKFDVADAPSVDAVPVVRCIDCCFHEDEEPGMVWCPCVVGSWVPNNWYCAAGDRLTYEE